MSIDIVFAVMWVNFMGPFEQRWAVPASSQDEADLIGMQAHNSAAGNVSYGVDVLELPITG